MYFYLVIAVALIGIICSSLAGFALSMAGLLAIFFVVYSALYLVVHYTNCPVHPTVQKFLPRSDKC